MSISARRRRQLGVALLAIGAVLWFYKGFIEQQALDTTGVRPDFGMLTLVAAVLGGLGAALFVNSRK